MELREYIKVIKKNIKIILAIAVLVTVSSYIFSTTRPITYETSLSLFITKEGTQETDNFKYDGYYALQASEIFADTIQEWMKSPEMVNEIYKDAGIDPNFKNIKSFTKKFKAKKMSPQYAEISFKTTSRADAGKISSSVIKVINSKTKKLQENSKEEISFKIESGAPVIMESRPDAFLNMIIGLVSGLTLGIFYVFTKEYFKV